MGTRLYPIMKQGHNQAEIVGATDIDVKLLEQLEADRKSGLIDDDGFYDALFNNPKYAKAHELNSFDLFGWGKFRPIEEQLGADGYLTCTGSLNDMNRVELLFIINDIDFDSISHLIDGVCWG